MTTSQPFDNLDMPELSSREHILPTYSQEACSWLGSYESFSHEASPEGFEDFHTFCGVWLLSSVAARRIYLPLRTMSVYPNLTIALCGDSSLFAKTTTARAAKALLHSAGLDFLLGAERTTPQKLLSDMSGRQVPASYAEMTPEQQERVSNRLAMAAQRGWYNDEFGKFVQAASKSSGPQAEFIDILMQLDSCPEIYENATLQRGAEAIYNPYISVLGAMTPANLQIVAKAGSEFWTDGFWARVSFATAPPDQYIDAPLSVGDIEIPHHLIEPLQEWHRRLGMPKVDIVRQRDKNNEIMEGKYSVIRSSELPLHRCTMDTDAQDAWQHYRSELKAMLLSFPHKDFHGSYDRLPTTALKMAMLMASLENDNHIEFRHWVRAQELAERLRRGLHELYRQVNGGQQSNRLEQALLTQISRIGEPVNARIIQRRCSQFAKMKAATIDVMLRSLVKAGYLVTYHEAGQIKYIPLA